VDGQDVYQLFDFIHAIDCLHVGTSIRKENGETYKWAIFCGPVVEGAKPEQNRDYGEYQCAAARQGARVAEEDGGFLSLSLPCQYIALAECGCGPLDVYPWGLPGPNGTCQPESDCPLLCEDVGIKYAQSLCRAFPDNISWWEGKNIFNSSLFLENVSGSDYNLEIYIKGVDT
jgi:hypothetical protein